MQYNEREVLFLQYNKQYGKWEDKTLEIDSYIPEKQACRVRYCSSSQWYYKSYKDFKNLRSPKAIELRNVVVFHSGRVLNNITLLLKFEEWYKVFYSNGKKSVYPARELHIEKDRRNEPGIRELISYL